MFVSGGEPTLHLHLFELLRAAYSRGFEHVVLISNGKRISEDPPFVASLAGEFPHLEIYLQFDSLDPKVLRDIRGMDLVRMRTAALTALKEAEISTTLVAVVKRGASLDDLGALLDIALSSPNVCGLTLQPLRASGRHDSGHVAEQEAPSQYEVIGVLAEAGPGVNGFVPHPLAPENASIAYVDRTTRTARTGLAMAALPADALIASPDSLDLPVVRVLIMSYLDRFNFRSDLVAEAPIHVLLPNGDLAPLDAYYLFGSSEGAPYSSEPAAAV